MERLSRRAFVGSLAALAVSPAIAFRSLSAQAQQPASPRHIGVLQAVAWPEELAQAFRQGLRDVGYSEGRDVVIEWRPANGDNNRLTQLAADLVQRKVDVIVVGGTLAAQEAKRATFTIPIVMTLVSDPVGSDLVTNLAHPGGNITGLSTISPDLTAKRLQLLKEAIQGLTRVAVLWNPDTHFQTKWVEDLKAAAPSLSVELKFVGVRKSEEFGAAFSAISRAHAQAVYLLESPLFFSQQMRLARLALQARLPSIYGTKAFADQGGLMSYGVNYADQIRRSARYVEKILTGAKPGDLPIEQPTRFELVVNLRTAHALGITIPDAIMLRADDVIR